MALVKKKKTPTTIITTPSTKLSNTKTSDTVAATKAPVRKSSVRKPIVPKQAEPKEVTTHVPPKKAEQGEAGKSPEASKPIVTSESPGTPAQPRPAYTGAPGSERISIEAMRAMEHADRYALWKRLNRNNEKFVPLRKELPKKEYMRKDEAIIRKLIGDKPKVKNALVYYCCYCVDWQVFHSHSWTGYNKCISCGMTTKDMYIGVDNGIFGKE